MKYGKSSDKKAKEMPWNKLFVYIIYNYVIRIKWKNKDLILRAVNMIDPITVWFEITEYYDKPVITIVNLVEST